MGMFDKDKQFGRRLDQEFEPGVPFILHGVKLDKGDVIQTQLGEQQVCRLDVESITDDRKTCVERFEANTIASAIVDKAKEAAADDFPAMVTLKIVKSKTWNTDALVLQWLGEVPGDLLGTSLPI